MNLYRAFGKEANHNRQKHAWTLNVDLIALDSFWNNNKSTSLFHKTNTEENPE